MNFPSRCTSPRKRALEWHFCFDLDNHSYQEFLLWKAELSAFSRSQVAGEMRALRIRAAQGLVVPQDRSSFAVVKSFPEIYELKWTFILSGAEPVHVRQYHGEPRLDEDILVACQLHIKHLQGSREEIRQAQNKEMAFAQARFMAGLTSGWKLC